MSYLSYLPFCMVFTSNDKLHARTALLFMAENQRFVWGGELKEEMRRLDAHYSSLPSEVLDEGLMRFPKGLASFSVVKRTGRSTGGVDTPFGGMEVRPRSSAGRI